MFFCWRKDRDYFANASSSSFIRLSALPACFRPPFIRRQTLFPEFLSHFPKKNTGLKPVFFCWRKGRDSNSGRARTLDGFQDRCIKPLCHLSILTMCFIIIFNENRHDFVVSRWFVAPPIYDSKTALIKPLKPHLP